MNTIKTNQKIVFLPVGIVLVERASALIQGHRWGRYTESGDTRYTL